MTTLEGWNTCRIVCCVVAAIVGLAVFLMSRDAITFVGALLAGAILAIILWIVLTRLFCNAQEDRSYGSTPADTRSDAVPAKPESSEASSAATSETKAEAVKVDTVEASASVDVETVPDSDGPVVLEGPRDGQADDLKRLKGVGPKLEQTLNELGFYHFDQIAAWNADDIAWVDSRLKFKGRIERDGWVDQAGTLASGGETEFAKRVDKGDVY